MKRECTVHHIDAFSVVPNKGNPAGVVVETESLDERAMQAIARKAGFGETAFVFTSSLADYGLRFFTPGGEVPLCGHASVAAVSLLCAWQGVDCEFMVETRAGVLPVSYSVASGLASVGQEAPRFRGFSGQPAALAEVLGVEKEDLDSDWPIVYGGVGSWTLLVPLRSERTLFAMTPNNDAFPYVLEDEPHAAIHPFAAGGDRYACDFLARHFPSPFSGVREDPVTASAAGVVGAYAMTHLYPGEAKRTFVMRQGTSVGRDGRVHVDVRRDGEDLRLAIKGVASYVKAVTVRY